MIEVSEYDNLWNCFCYCSAKTSTFYYSIISVITEDMYFKPHPGGSVVSVSDS